jgi:hypothetical protein
VPTIGSLYRHAKGDVFLQYGTLGEDNGAKLKTTYLKRKNGDTCMSFASTSTSVVMVMV